MKTIELLLVFMFFNLSLSKHNFFRTGRKNNLYVVFSKFDLNKLSRKRAGLIV